MLERFRVLGIKLWECQNLGIQLSKADHAEHITAQTVISINDCLILFEMIMLISDWFAYCMRSHHNVQGHLFP